MYPCSGLSGLSARRLLGIFQHETAERFPGLAEHEVVHTFSDEEQKAPNISGDRPGGGGASGLI